MTESASTSTGASSRRGRLSSLRAKVVFIVFACTIGLMLVLFIPLRSYWLDNYIAIERDAALQDTARAVNVLEDEVASLQQTTTDYSIWDDTYNYVHKRNQDYIDTNYPPTTFESNRLNLVVISDNAGKVLFSRAYDLVNGQDAAVLDTFQTQLQDAFRTTPDTKNGLSGVLMTTQGPLLISVWPILTSINTGPSDGTFVMGRWLNDQLAQQFAAKTRLNLDIHPFNADMPSADLREAQAYLSKVNPTLVQPLSESVVASYALVTDVFAQPALILRVQSPRHVYSQAQASLPLFAALLALTGFLIGIAILLLLERFVFLRLVHISEEVKHIGAQGDLSRRVNVKGNDELTDLAVSINTMLGSLEQIESDLMGEQERSERLLLNILPESVATELDQQHSAIEDHPEEISVLYANVVDATRVSNYDTPAVIGQWLAEVWKTFNALVQKHGAEKIKTTDEMYVAVAGLSQAITNHAEVIAALALDMQQALDELNRQHNSSFELRVGIHTGPVAMGAVGAKKFVYDLWGETLTIAHQVEDKSVVNEILLTENTYALVKNKFYLEEQGYVFVRSKQQAYRTYRLVGRGKRQF